MDATGAREVKGRPVALAHGFRHFWFPMPIPPAETLIDPMRLPALRLVLRATPLVYLLCWLSLLVSVACSRGSDRAVDRSGTPAPLSSAEEDESGLQRRDTTVLRIMSGLSQDSVIRDDSVLVTGTGRQIILQGSVRNADARERVLVIAREHVGTLVLVDSLRVRERKGR
jgi:hypothetical protein